MKKRAERREYFSRKVDSYFINWIQQNTWHTMNFYDMERFYRFIHALRRFPRREYSEKDIENKIKKAAIEYHKNFDRKILSRAARDFARIAILCRDCLRVSFYPYQNKLIVMQRIKNARNKNNERN